MIDQETVIETSEKTLAVVTFAVGAERANERWSSIRRGAVQGTRLSRGYSGDTCTYHNICRSCDPVRVVVSTCVQAASCSSTMISNVVSVNGPGSAIIYQHSCLNIKLYFKLLLPIFQEVNDATETPHDTLLRLAQ